MQQKFTLLTYLHISFLILQNSILFSIFQPFSVSIGFRLGYFDCHSVMSVLSDDVLLTQTLTVTMWCQFWAMSCLHNWHNDSLIYHSYFHSRCVCLTLCNRLSFVWLNHTYTSDSCLEIVSKFLLLLAYRDVFAGRWLFLFLLLSCNRKYLSLSNVARVLIQWSNSKSALISKAVCSLSLWLWESFPMDN